MRYSLESYDRNGFLKAPIFVWSGWLFLARAWVVFIMAGVTRDSGSKLLAMFYPDSYTLYLGMALGFPCLLLMWLMGLRKPERKWINYIVKYGREITVSLCFIQLIQTVYDIYQSHGAFNWTNAVSITLLSWLMIYLLNGRWVKDCFYMSSLK